MAARVDGRTLLATVAPRTWWRRASQANARAWRRKNTQTAKPIPWTRTKPCSQIGSKRRQRCSEAAQYAIPATAEDWVLHMTS